MPLRVHCPTGCLLKLPTGRAGQVVRCHECGEVIRLPSISNSEIKSGKPIPVYAERVAGATETADNDQDVERIEIQVDAKPQKADPGHQVSGSSKIIIEDGGKSNVEDAGTDAAKHAIDDLRSNDMHGNDLPSDNKPSSDHVSASHADSPGNREASVETTDEAPVESVSVQASVGSVESEQNAEWASDEAAKSDEFDFDFSSLSDERAELDDDVPVVIGSEERVTIHDDRRFLVHFFAVCVSLLGIAMAIPAGWYWWDMANSDIVAPLPRWVFLLLFVSGLHLVYSFFLFQLPDWSAMWAVSIVMVVLTAVYGFVSAGVWLDEGGGPIVQFLQVPTSFLRNAKIWTLVMLCLSGLCAYIFGREAIAWKHAARV